MLMICIEKCASNSDAIKLLTTVHYIYMMQIWTYERLFITLKWTLRLQGSKRLRFVKKLGWPAQHFGGGRIIKRSQILKQSVNLKMRSKD